MKQKIAHYNAENGTISTSSQGAFPMKNVEVLLEDGEFALFFRPHRRGFDSSRVSTPGNLQRKKTLIPGGQRGEGLGAAGIDLCITLAKFWYTVGLNFITAIAPISSTQDANLLFVAKWEGRVIC